MRQNQSGERIRVARAMQKPDISQKDLVARMQLEGFKVSENMISRIEIGARYVTDLELIGFAKVLKVSIVWLLGETNDPTRNR